MNTQKELSYAVMGLDARYSVKVVTTVSYMPQFEGVDLIENPSVSKMSAESVCLYHESAHKQK